MRNLFVVFSLLFITVPAFAHLELGVYAGKTVRGEDCSFEVRSVEFVDGREHPLNERVVARVGGRDYVLQHQPRIDVEKGTVLFDRENLSSAVGTESGGMAAVLKMAHTSSYHGPERLTVLLHDYNPEVKMSVVCDELKHVQ